MYPGEDLAGYTSHVRAARPGIDLYRLVLLMITWGLPVLLMIGLGLGLVTVLRMITWGYRTGGRRQPLP